MSAKKDRGPSFERRDVTRDVAKKVTVRVVVLAIFLGLLHSMMGNENLTGVARGIMETIVPPVALASVLLVASLLVGLLFRGYLVAPVSVSLLALSAAFFIYLMLSKLSVVMGDDGMVAAAANFAAMAGVAIAAYVPLKSWAWQIAPVPPSVAAILLAAAFYRLFSGLLPQTLLLAVSVTVSVAGAIRILSVLGGRKGAAAGKGRNFIGSGPFMAIAVTFVLFAVLFQGWLWPEVNRSFPDRAPIVFWISVCAMLALCGAALVLYLKSKKLDARFGTWGKKINDIVANDPELASAAATIREFVDEGRKEGLIVKMTAILLSNGVGEKAVREVIADVARHSERTVAMAFFTSYLGMREEARAERERKVLAMLVDASRKMGAAHVVRELPGR